MAVETFLALPRWIYVGLVVGALMSVCVVATFLLASRYLPDGNRQRGTWRSTEQRRRAEIRQYLDAIDERYAEDAGVAGETVAFYLPDRDVAVTFDARTFLALERTPTHGVLVEHEMPGVALGHRLPFETPEVAFRRRGSGTATGSVGGGRGRRGEADPTPASAAYAVLGLPSGADEEAARRAYRERIKEVHPDQGGDEAEFRRVQEAYDTVRRHGS